MRSAERILHALLLVPLLLVSQLAGNAQTVDSVYTSDSVRIVFETDGYGTPVYFLAGGPAIHPEYMMRIAKLVKGNFQRVVLHQRETGLSQKNLPVSKLTIDRYCMDIEAVRKKLGHDKIILIGHSWGGMLAMNYAAHYHDKILKMTLVSSGGCTTEFLSYFNDNILSRLSREELIEYKTLAAKRKGLINDTLLDDKHAVLNNLDIQISNYLVRGYLYNKDYDSLFQLNTNTSSPSVRNIVFQSLIKAKWNISEVLIHKVKCPVLVIQGRQDPIGFETAFQINKSINSSSLQIIEKAGHFPWVEQEKVFSEKINAFLNN